MEQKKMDKKLVIGIVVLVICFLIFAFMYSIFRSKPVEGKKDISIEVISKEQESVMYEVSTTAEFLRQAMEEAEGLSFEGDEGEFGMMVHTVNGEKADYTTDGAYWSFYVNDAYCNYGIDTQPVMDGDAFKIVYETAQVE